MAGDWLGGLGGEGWVARHGLPTDSGPAHHERGPLGRLTTDRVRGPLGARGSRVCWLPLETLPLGTHKGHPYRERTRLRMTGRGHHERGCVLVGLRAEEAGLRPAPTSERVRTAGDWLGGLGAAGFVVRHGPPTDSGPAHHERGPLGRLTTDRVREPLGARGSRVCWLPLETLPLGTHKGHPYRNGRASE